MVKKKKPKIIRGKSKDKINRDIWTLFDREEEKEERKKKHDETIIKARIIGDIRILFEQEEDDHEPRGVSSFWNNTYIEYESNGDKNRNLSHDEYLNKIETYLRNIITHLQNSDACKIRLAIAINFIFLNDTEEEPVMHASSGNVNFTPYSDANDVIDRNFRNINERKWFYFRFSSTNVLKVS